MRLCARQYRHPLDVDALASCSSTQLSLKHISVELLHDLEHEGEAVHEGIDGDAQHAVRGRAVVDPQNTGGVFVVHVSGSCSCRVVQTVRAITRTRVGVV